MSYLNQLLLFLNILVIMTLLNLILIRDNRHYEALSRALVEGCSPDEDRVALAIENYCTVTKTKKGK